MYICCSLVFNRQELSLSPNSYALSVPISYLQQVSTVPVFYFESIGNYLLKHCMKSISRSYGVYQFVKLYTLLRHSFLTMPVLVHQNWSTTCWWTQWTTHCVGNLLLELSGIFFRKAYNSNNPRSNSKGLLTYCGKYW